MMVNYWVVVRFLNRESFDTANKLIFGEGYFYKVSNASIESMVVELRGFDKEHAQQAAETISDDLLNLGLTKSDFTIEVC